MKTVYIIRHAKSAQGGLFQSDFDRPLNDRGRKDAPVMAARLLVKKITIDAFISSSANRALSTCKLFCQAFNADTSQIIAMDKLYHAPKEAIYDVIRDANNRHHSLAIFCHNPGITDFANSLCHGLYIDNMPTCAVIAVQADIESWDEFRTSEKTFLFFDYPKA